MTIPPRVLHEQLTHVIRFDIAFNAIQNDQVHNTAALAAAALALGVQIGTLPPGAVPVSTNIYADQAFNNGTTNTASVGFTATGTDLVSAAALGSQAAVITAAPIAAVAAAKAVTAAAGQPVYLSTSQTGTAATTGRATVIVTYHPALG
jgi:hypothetical protein